MKLVKFLLPLFLFLAIPLTLQSDVVQFKVGLFGLDHDDPVVSWLPLEATGGLFDNINPVNTGLETTSRKFLFDGTAWDRARTLPTSDAITTTDTGLTARGQILFNGSTWDRRRSLPSDDDTTPTSGFPANGMLLYNINIDDWTRARDAGVGDDITSNDGIQVILPVVVDESGGNFDRIRAIDAGTLTSTTVLGIQAVGQISTWSEHDLPIAATQAIASKAAGAAGVRHVTTSITACLLDTDSVDAQAVVLRDGATGAGTILWAAQLGVSAVSGSQCITMPITITGSAATAMTLEFSSAGSANSFETVTLTGYSVQ